MQLSDRHATVAPVRPARPEDLQQVEELLTDARLPLTGVPESFHDFIVAERGDRIVAALGLEDYGEYALLRSAVVAPDWQGHGLGTQLTWALIEHARATGRHALFLLTDTAGSYFPRFGFVRVTRAEVPDAVQRSVEFSGACPTTAAIMRLDIP